MFMCYTKRSSVINLIYSRHLLFPYKKKATNIIKCTHTFVLFLLQVLNRQIEIEMRYFAAVSNLDSHVSKSHVSPGNPYRTGRLSTVDLLNKIGRFS